MKKEFLQHPLAPYAVATLFPVPFLLLGSVFGAAWILPALLWLTVVKLAADRLLSERITALWRPGAGPAPDAGSAGAVLAAVAAGAVDIVPEVPEAEKPEADAGAGPGAPAADQPEAATPASDDLLAAEIAAMVRGAGTDAPLRAVPLATAADAVVTAPVADEGLAREARRARRLPRVPRLADLPRRNAGGPRRQPGPTEQADRLSAILGAVHFLLLAAALYGLSGGAGYGFWGWLMAFLTFGIWFGQVSNANAHDLIHARDRRLRRLGMWIYISMLNGQHVSAHRLVHHRFVATADDPNTASLGESFYAFAARAWPGAFIAGYEMERAIGRRRFGGRGRRVHPYVIYGGGAAAVAVAVLALFGLGGWLVWLLLSAHALMQLLMSDYVQHYGLVRRTLPDGRPEPLGPRHSWDAPQPFSAWLTLNAPHHAEHHLHPARAWSELDAAHDTGAPRLPHSLAVMGAIALVPPQWRRLMDERVEALTMSKRAAMAARI